MPTTLSPDTRSTIKEGAKRRARASLPQMEANDAVQDAISAGKRHAERGDLARAIKAFDKATMLVPPDLLVKCGGVNVLRGNYKVAFRCYRLAESQPKLRELHRHLKDSGYDALAEEVSKYIVMFEDAA